MSYQPLTISQGADGYLVFFTGTSGIAGDNDLFWDRANNNLGIGTSSPTNKLEIVSGETVIAKFRGDGAVGRVFVDSSSNTGFSLSIDGSSKWALASYLPNGTNYSFVFYNDQTATNSLFIHGDTDNVGIGTNSPSVRLDVNGSLHVAGAILNDDLSETFQVIRQALDGYGAGGGDVIKVGTPVDNQVGVWTGDGTLEGDADLTWDGGDLLVKNDSASDFALLKIENNTSGYTGFTAGLYAQSNTGYIQILTYPDTGTGSIAGEALASSARINTTSNTSKLLIGTSTDSTDVPIHFFTSGTKAITIDGANQDVSIYADLSIGGNIINKDLSETFQVIRQALDGYGGGGGSIDGSGAATRVTFWSDGDTLTSDANFIFNSTADRLVVGGVDNSNWETITAAGTDAALCLAPRSDGQPSYTVWGGKIWVDSSSPYHLKFISTDNTVYDLCAGASGVTGSGVATRVAFWDGTGSITSDAEFVYNSSSNRLTVGGADNSNYLGLNTVGSNAGVAIGDRASMSYTVWAGKLWVRTSDKHLCFTDQNNNLYDLCASTVGGSGAANRITYWSGANTLTSSTELTYDGTHLQLTGVHLRVADGSRVIVGNSTTSGWLDINSYGDSPGIAIRHRDSGPSYSVWVGQLWSKTSDKHLYYTDQNNNTWDLLSPTITPAGSDGQIQYNNGGSLGGTAQLYWDDANNRVGLGTSSPSVDLHVQRSSSGSDVTLAVENTNTANTWATVKAISASGTQAMIIANNDAMIYSFDGVPRASAAELGTWDASRLTLWTNNEAPIHLSPQFKNVLTVTPERNVGINTLYPFQSLTVNGAIALQDRDTPTNEVDGYGLLYTKSDDKIYFKPYGQSEIDLTSGGDGGGVSEETVQEHYNQHSEAIQTIIKDLDGYTSITGGGFGDGYVLFFTGPTSVAGDNDLFWDRVNNNLGIGTQEPEEKLDVAGTIVANALKAKHGAVDGYVLTSEPDGYGIWKDPAIMFERLVVTEDGRLVLDGNGNPMYIDLED